MNPRPRRRGWLWLAALPLGTLAVLVFLRALSAGDAPPHRQHVVEIRGMTFHPAVLEVARGDTVVWMNQDIVPHTATAAGSWDTGTLAPGQRGSHVARRKGEVRYICTLHPTMQGKLIIQ